MSPAYLLFSLQIYVYKGIGQITLCGLVLPWIAILIIGLSLLSVFIIKKILYKTKKREENVLNINLKVIQIKQTNGDIVSFFVGIILPAVFFIEESLTVSICVFVTIQILIFILVSKSSTIFPNVIMILLGLNVYSLSNGKYLISNLSVNDITNRDIDCIRLGDESNLLAYLSKEA